MIPESPQFEITVTTGPYAGQTFPITSEYVTIGRSDEADILIEDSQISRVHCRVSFDGHRWFIEDLNSTNGTWLVGQNLSDKAYLAFNTPVRIGKTVFEIVNCLRKHTDSVVVDGWSILQKVSEHEMASRIESNSLLTGNIGNASTGYLLDAIYSFQHSMSTIQDECELYPRMLFALSKLMSDFDLYVLTYNVDRSQFEIKASQLADGMSHPQHEIRLPLVDQVCQSRNSSVFTNADNDLVVVVPMRGKQQINGILYLAGFKSRISDFSVEELRMLSVIGYIAGMSVEHSRAIDLSIQRYTSSSLSVATVADLTHTVKNVVTGLDGCMDLLQIGLTDRDPALTDEAWGILNKNYQRLSNITIDLLNLFADQKLTLKVQNVSFLIKEIQAFYGNRLSADKIRLSLHSPDHPLLAEVDIDELWKLLQNLIQYSEHSIQMRRNITPDEGVDEISVSFDESPDHTMLKITVSCNGLMVSQEDAVHCFELSVTKPGDSVNAIQLAVCHKIAEAHSGRLDAFPTSPNGFSAFVCEIPFTHTQIGTTTCTIKRIH